MEQAKIKKQLEYWCSCFSQHFCFDDDMLSVYQSWYSDLTDSKYGYPRKAVKTTPYVEEFFLNKTRDHSFQKRQPAVFLTHDIDYLYPTFIMWLKKALGRRQFSLSCFREDFLGSLEEYLKIDKSYIGTASGHLFVAAAKRPLNLCKHFLHYFIDPSYKLSSKHATMLSKLIQRYEASVGIHGSFFSLLDFGDFKTEKQVIETWSEKEVLFNRQHWLNISSINELKKLYAAGIRFDSSLGWNGCLGIRGGFLRPYPIYLGESKLLWEIPMLLMDGVLFDELRLSEKDAVEAAINSLQQVKIAGGCVALNWHERTRSKSYGWGNAYDKILEWCKKQGFLFYSSEKVIERIKEHEGKYIFKAN